MPFTKIKPKKATSDDPYSGIPIPPKSVVRFSPLAPKKSWKKDIGKVYRIGYYGKRDGLDCIWLVDDLGEYCETLDHNSLFKYFEIIMISDETDLYGVNQPQIPPIRKAGRVSRRTAKKKSSVRKRSSR